VIIRRLGVTGVIIPGLGVTGVIIRRAGVTGVLISAQSTSNKGQTNEEEDFASIDGSVAWELIPLFSSSALSWRGLKPVKPMLT